VVELGLDTEIPEEVSAADTVVERPIEISALPVNVFESQVVAIRLVAECEVGVLGPGAAEVSRD
jgi:hypothetical protein